MPVACMWAYMIVVPTNLKPRCFRSRLKASDSGVAAGISPDLAPATHQWLAADEAPAVARKAAEFLLDLEETACVLDGRLDLEPVAHDARKQQQLRDLARVETSDLRGIEIRERLADNRLVC